MVYLLLGKGIQIIAVRYFEKWIGLLDVFRVGALEGELRQQCFSLKAR
jgi:hypothetical protein